MTAAFLLTVLVASLSGSMHCAAMCGPLVGLYAGQTRRHLPHGLYNLGRLAAYLTLGIAAGALGATLDLSGATLAGAQRVSAVIAGVIVVAWALAELIPAGLRPALPAALPRWLHRSLRPGLRRVATLPVPARALGLGLLTGLLPCGWLYLFVVAAAGTGRPLAGAGLMAAFWVGSLPILLGTGYGLAAASAKLRARARPLVALLLLAFGLATLCGRFDLAGGAVARPDATDLPCCHGGE